MRLAMGTRDVFGHCYIPVKGTLKVGSELGKSDAEII